MQGQNTQDDRNNTSQVQIVIAPDNYILLDIFIPVSH